MRFAIAIVLLIIVAAIIGAGGMFLALSNSVEDDPDNLTDADSYPASLIGKGK